MKQELDSLYVLKALGAITVVFIHSYLGGNREGLLHFLALNIGVVNIFFAITGYFLYSPDSKILCSRLLKTAKKVCPILLIALVIYYVLTGPSDIPPFTWENKMYYFRWFILGDAPRAILLWYLASLLWGALFLYLFTRLLGSRYIGVLILFALLNFMVDEQNWSLFFPSKPNWVFNPILTSIPMISVGMMIRKYEVQLLARTGYWWWTIGIIISILIIRGLHLDEKWFAIVPHFSPWTLTTIAFPPICFMAFLSLKEKKMNKYLTFMGKHLSAHIYYWHFLIGTLIIDATNGYTDWDFFYVLFLSILLAWLIYKVKMKLRKYTDSRYTAN